jgi:hypothetical protein
VGVPVPQQERCKEGHPIPRKPVFCPNEMFHPRSALANEPEPRGSRLASRDPVGVTPTQPSPIKGEGVRMFELCA